MQNAGGSSHAGAAELDTAVRPVRLAPLKDGLVPQKRAFAESLRTVFLALEISVRRYAARRHVDPATLTRYLSGERLPPWDFVAHVIADVNDVGASLTPEAEAGIRALHRAAQKANRRNSQVQVLQDQLEEADEETRRIKTRERALDEALYSRQQRLADAQGRCRRLEAELAERKIAHRAEVELWRGEYEQVLGECSDLQEQVLYLQEALAVARAELIAAEDQCHRLEVQLEVLHEVGGDVHGGPESDRLTLMAALEAADQSVSVPELVATVGDLESRTRRAMASELVKSVSRSREIADVVGLMIALHEADFDVHASTALPAMVMTRSVQDIGILTCELLRAGMAEHALTLLRTSVELHRPADVASFAQALHHGGLPEYARTLVEAAAAVRPVADVVSLTLFLPDHHIAVYIPAAMEAAGTHRSVPDLTALAISLCHAERADHCQALLQAAAGRPATEVADLMASLSRHTRNKDADTVFQAAQERGTGHLISLLYALLQTDEHDRAWSVIAHAARTRPVTEVAVIVADLLATDRRQHAAQMLLTALQARSIDDRRALFAALHGQRPGPREIIAKTASDSRPEDAAALLVHLNVCGFPALAEVVFQHTLRERPAGHCGVFLASLVAARADQTTARILRRRTTTSSPSDVALLLTALASSVKLKTLLDAVTHSCATARPIADLVQLIKQTRNRDSAILPQADLPVSLLIAHATSDRATPDLVAFIVALEAAGMKTDAVQLEGRAVAEHGRSFKNALYKERTKHEQKVLSTTFWRKEPPRHALDR